MATRPSLRRRAVSALLLAALAGTSSGLGGLELLWHLGVGDDGHAKSAHVEAAGATGHADHCQLGLAHSDPRLAAGPAARVRLALASPSAARSAGRVPPRAVHQAPDLPRAPPALG